MKAWEKNLAPLRERLPEAARRVEAARPAAPFAARESATAARLATRWLGGRSWSDGVLLAVSGFGDGAHVRALLAAAPARCVVFVAEADAAQLRAVLEAHDCSAILRDPRLLIGVGSIDDDFFSALNAVAVLEASDVAALIFAPCYNLAPEYYAKAFAEFARQVDFRHKLHGTAVVDAALWQANTFENLPRLAVAPDVGALRHAWRELPMVLISAGPSLDESLEFVRAAGRVAVIVAVNSSYRAVRRAGIVPHLVLAADPRGFTAKGFEGVPVDGTWLVTTPIVNPAVVSLFGARVFTWSGANLLMTEIRRRCGLPPGTALIEQGTVSACAVDLAVVLGCRRVCLVGQDLAVRADGLSHASDSFYSDLGANQTEVAGCRWMPGNTLPRVPVEEKLFVYLKTFEQLVAKRPRLEFLNTARLGARIAGVPFAEFSAALKWLGQGDAASVPAVLAQRHAGARAGERLDLARVGQVLEPTAAYARDVLKAALRAAMLLEALPDALAAADAADAPAVREALQAEEHLRHVLQRSPSDYQILEAGRTRLELFRSRETQRGIAASEPHWRRILAAREFVWAIAEGAWFLSKCLRPLAASAPTPETNVKPG